MSYLRFSYGLSGRIATVNSRVIDRKNFWRIIDLSVTVETKFQLKSTNIRMVWCRKSWFLKPFLFLYLFCFAIDKWHNISENTSLIE